MSKDVLTTRDYKIFKTLVGNRPTDPMHVKELIRSFTQRGNLTNNFPIVVNENMEVIDGQNRLAALEELGWEVGYRVEEGLNITSVRDINSAQRNWNWKDYANSFAILGNDNYKRLLEVYEQFGVGYHVLALYCGFRRGKGIGTDASYTAGNLTLTPEDKERATVLLAQAAEIVEALEEHNTGSRPKGNRTLYAALFIIFQSPDYDHKRMMNKVTNHGARVLSYTQINDQLRSFEDVYNFNVKDGSEPVRLF